MQEAEGREDGLGETKMSFVCREGILFLEPIAPWSVAGGGHGAAIKTWICDMWWVSPRFDLGAIPLLVVVAAFVAKTTPIRESM